LKDIFKFAGPGAFALIVNKSSEVEAVAGGIILVWRNGRWLLFDPSIFIDFIGDSLNEFQARKLVSAIYALSKIRHGTVVVLTDTPKEEIDKLKKGSVSKKGSTGDSIIRNLLQNKKIDELRENAEIIRILTADGITIFNSSGRLVDTGFIIDTAKSDATISGGGRTAAAFAASQLGKTIKVSEDGPIDLIYKGKRLYRFG
jgi:DNA integrity scanning protein DisA with diadenylate cyclase activity